MKTRKWLLFLNDFWLKKLKLRFVTSQKIHVFLHMVIFMQQCLSPILREKPVVQRVMKEVINEF